MSKEELMEVRAEHLCLEIAASSPSRVTHTDTYLIIGTAALSLSACLNGSLIAGARGRGCWQAPPFIQFRSGEEGECVSTQ